MDYNNESKDRGSTIPDRSEEVNLREYWRVIKKYKKMIAGILLTVSVAAVIISLVLPKSYKAESVIIPLSSKGVGGGLGALASQFGGLASLAGFSVGGEAGDTEKIIAILRSRTLNENVINAQRLMPIIFEDAWDEKAGKWKSEDFDEQKNMEKAVRIMRKLVLIGSDKKAKTIKITGEFRDPKLAARVVNAYIDELQKFIVSNAFTTAKRNRIFIEEQLAENKRDLLEAGKEITVFYKTNRVSSSEADLDVNVDTVVDVDAHLGEKAKLAAMGASGNAAMRNLLAEKAQVESRLAEARTVKDVPQQVYLTYLMLRRELLAKVNALLTTQYEMAKIEETKEDLTFQVIDSAVPPVRKYRPKRAQICIMFFFAALFASIVIAFSREYVYRQKALKQKRHV